jgi:hypothetical protein
MRHRGGEEDGGDDAQGYTGISTPVYSDQDWTRDSGAGEADGARRDRSLSITRANNTTSGKVENGLLRRYFAVLRNYSAEFRVLSGRITGSSRRAVVPVTRLICGFCDRSDAKVAYPVSRSNNSWSPDPTTMPASSPAKEEAR